MHSTCSRSCHPARLRRTGFAVGLFVVLTSTTLAQEEPSRLHYTVPNDWRLIDDGRTFVPPSQLVAVTFAPSLPFTGNAEAWANEAWDSVVRELQLVSGPVRGKHGPFLTRQGAFRQPTDGSTVSMLLYTLVRNGRGESVVLMAREEAHLRAHVAVLHTMLQEPGAGAGSQPVPAASRDPAPPSDRTSHANPSGRTPTLDDYEFTPPAGWLVQKRPDHLLLTQGSDPAGCVIQILPPQPSSGDLEGDAEAVFAMMYPGWQYQQRGDRQYVLSRGVLAQGQEYSMKEATMSSTGTDGRYHLEEGVALVVRAGGHVAIIAARHRGLLAHNNCQNRYDTWRRFFNTFTIRGAPVTADAGNVAQRIVGVWSQTESGASSEYVFAANGQYARTGTLGSVSTSADDRYEYLHLKTYAFEGDGSYAIAGPVLNLSQRGQAPESLRFRFEQVNHGGTGWKDRLWLLRKDHVGESEVVFERKGNPPPLTADAPAVGSAAVPSTRPLASPTTPPRDASPVTPPRPAPPATPPDDAPPGTQRIAGVFLHQAQPNARPWIVLFGGDGRIALEGLQHVIADPACPPRAKGTYEILDGRLTLKLEGGFTRTLPIQLEGGDPLNPQRIVLNHVVFSAEQTPSAPTTTVPTP